MEGYEKQKAQLETIFNPPSTLEKRVLFTDTAVVASWVTKQIRVCSVLKHAAPGVFRPVV